MCLLEEAAERRGWSTEEMAVCVVSGRKVEEGAVKCISGDKGGKLWCSMARARIRYGEEI